MTRELKVHLTFSLLVALSIPAASVAATLRWSGGGGSDLTLDTSQAAQCTLIVARDPLLASIDGFSISWCGNGRLEFISPAGGSTVTNRQGSTASPRERADAASNRRTLDLGPSTSEDLQLIVRVVSGTRFDITLVEIGNDRALRWPVSRQPRVSINRGAGLPFRPELIAVTQRVAGDSIAFWITGLGLAHARQVLHTGIGGPRSLPFAVYGDTAIRVATPMAGAHRGRKLVVINSAGVGSSVEGDVRALIPPPGPRQILAALRPTAQRDALNAIGGVTAIAPIDQSPSRPDSEVRSDLEDLTRVLVLDVAAGQDPEAVLADVRANSSVQSADLVTVWGPEPFREPIDTYWNEQWGLHDAVGLHCNGSINVEPGTSINLPAAWDYPPLMPDVSVSIVDSGVEVSHDDVELVPDTTLNKSFRFGDPAWWVDSDNHGTAVASIASALTNGSGMAGASWPTVVGYNYFGFPVWGGLPASVKIGWTWPSISSAIDFAADAPRPLVINMSLGGETISADEKRTLLQACKNAFLNGHLLVAAAGNVHDDFRTYPAGFDEYVLAIGATLWNGLYWTNANAWPPSTDDITGTKFGPWLDVMAPGGLGITAAWALGNQGYFDLDHGSMPQNLCDLQYIASGAHYGFSGTSASAPLVSGTAAWLKKIQSTLTGEDLAQVLQRTATDLGVEGRDDLYGHGRINAAAAASLVSRPNWVKHGALGAGGDAPLAIQADSIAGTIAISYSNDFYVPDRTYSCVRYRLAGTAAFESGFTTVPDMWVRRAESKGMPPVASWDDDQQPPWASILSYDQTQGSFESYVYRLTDLGNRFYPCAPEEARIAYTAIAPSQTLDVSPNAAPMALSVRTRLSPARSRASFDAAGLSPGPLRVEVFDVTGRRMSTLFEGSFAGGHAAFEWDGRIQGATPCNAGIYVCRVEQPGRRSACRFAFLR